MSGSIFVSYRRRGGWAVDSIARRLEAEFGAEKVFVDVKHIPPGAEFQSVLRRALAGASALVVVLDDDWHKQQDPDSGKRRLDDEDDWVREEIRTALENETYIIPLLLDAAQLPKADWLPADIKSFVKLQVCRVRQANVDHDLDVLAAALAARGIPRLRGASGAAASAGSSELVVPEPAGSSELVIPELDPRPAAEPIVIALESADAKLGEWQLLAAERHLTVTLSPSQVAILGSIGDRLSRSSTRDEIIGMGIEAWEHLCEASPRLAGLFDTVARAERADGVPQLIAWTGDAALLTTVHRAVLVACPDSPARLPFLSLRSGAHYFCPLAPADLPPRRMQRRANVLRVAQVDVDAVEPDALKALADALANDVLLLSSTDAGHTVGRLVELLPRCPDATTRVAIAFGAAAIDAPLVQAALAVLPCVSFAGPGTVQRQVAAQALPALRRALHHQPLPVLLSHLRRAAAESMLGAAPGGDVAALREVLAWSTWSWVGRPLFATGFGEVRKAAGAHLMDLRSVAAAEWYYERSEDIPELYQTATLIAGDAEAFHLYVSGAGGTGKSCFLRSLHDKFEFNYRNVLRVWYKVHAPSSDWGELDAQIKIEVRAALARRLGTAGERLLTEADDAKELWKFLLDLLTDLRSGGHGIDRIVLFIDQLERTFELGDSPELERLTKIAEEIGKLLKGLGSDGSVRVFIASRKQYLADFLRSYQYAKELNLHFVVLQTLPVDIEGAAFVERIVGWCRGNDLVPASLTIDREARRLLAVSDGGHPLNMMLSLIRLLSQVDLPEELDRATLERRQPWQQRFRLDEALMGKDELDWYFFLAMAHARTEIVRREEVLWRLGLISHELTRRVRELGPNGVIERLWVLGHLGRTIHPRRRGEIPAGFLEFFHANLRDHLVTNVMNQAEEPGVAGSPGSPPTVRRRRGMPPAWRALDRLREIARDWQQLQQPLSRDDIAVLMEHRESFCEPIAVTMEGRTKEVESFYLMFMRDAGNHRDALFLAAKECVAYSALVHDVLGRWAFGRLFPIVAAPDAGSDAATQVGCCRRWLRAGRADAMGRSRILQHLVELHDAQANRLMTDLAITPDDEEDDTWRQLADILADPLVAATHRSAFIAAALQRLSDRGIVLWADNKPANRLGALLVAACSGDAHEVSHLLETLVQEVALLDDTRLVGALRDLSEPARVERWLQDAGEALTPRLVPRELNDIAPPAMELRAGDQLAGAVDDATLQRWSGELAAGLGVPIPSLARAPRYAETSAQPSTGHLEASEEASGNELELRIHGRLVGLARFFPTRVQTLTRDWNGEGTLDDGAITSFDDGLAESVRWVDPARLDAAAWRHPHRDFDGAVVAWLRAHVRRYIGAVFGPDELIAHLREVARQAGPARVPESDLQTLADRLGAVGELVARMVRERVPLSSRKVDILIRLVKLAREADSLEVALALPRLREHVREDLCRVFADDANRLLVLLLDGDDHRWLERRLKANKRRRWLDLNPQEALQLAAGVRDSFERVARQDHIAPVIACADQLREPLFDLLQSFDPRLHVLSYIELSPDLRLTSRGVMARFTPESP